MTNQNLIQMAYAEARKRSEQHIPHLHATGPDAREAAAEALGRLGTVEAIPELILLLSDPEPRVRWATIIALGDIGSPDVVQYLIPHLRDEDRGAREATACALGEMRTLANSAVGPLTELLSDTDSDVRIMAIEALGQIGSSEARAALDELLDSSTGIEKHCISSALNRISDDSEEQTIFLQRIATTPYCPTVGEFEDAVVRRWPQIMREHIRTGCCYCSAMTATVWSVEFPSISMLLAHALDNTTPSETDISRFILDRSQRDRIARMNSLSKLRAALTRGIEGVQNLGVWSWRSERLTLALSHESSEHSAACSDMVELGEDVRFSSSVDEGQRFLYFEAKTSTRLTVIVGNEDTDIQPIVEEVQLVISGASSESLFMYRAGLMLGEDKELFNRFGPEYYVHVARMT